jgi:hypothetical protein
MTLIAAVLLGPVLTPAQAAAPDTLVVNTTLDIAPIGCSSLCSLRDAIASVAPGGTITFDAAILPATLTLNLGPLVFLNSVDIEGPGPALLAVDAHQASRIVSLQSPGVSVVMSGMTLINGQTPVVNGSDGAAGTGNPGGAGSQGAGGCIEMPTGKLTLVRVALRNCTARGGDGGHGGSGVTQSKGGGKGGAGGSGGDAIGGAIFANINTQLVLSQTSIVDAHAIGGAGGNGGTGGDGAFVGNGGDGGHGGNAAGGAVYQLASQSLNAINATLAESDASGGDGGDGGSGDPDFDLSQGGSGGGGGAARGGLYVMEDPYSTSQGAFAGFSTFANGLVAPGTHGNGGRGYNPGSPGADGSAVAPAIQILSSSHPLVHQHSAIFAAAGAEICSGLILGEYSFSSSANCAGNVTPLLATWFNDLDLEAPLPGHGPRSGTPAVNNGACNISSNPVFPTGLVTVDMRGTARPQGLQCDVGSIEAIDAIFANGFD